MIGWLSRKPRKDRADMTNTEPLRLIRQEQLDLSLIHI